MNTIILMMFLQLFTNVTSFFSKKKDLFLMQTIFKVFIEFVTILFLGFFYVLVFWP